MSNIYNILSVTLLLHRTNIKTYIKHKFRKEIIPNNGENPPYKPIMDNVIDCLIERCSRNSWEGYKYGNLNIVLYGQTKKLKDLCNEFMKYDEIEYWISLANK